MFWRVMAQVSCELVAPKESRPNEGILFFNIELSPLASPAFEAGRWVKDHYYSCGAALVSVTRTESSPVVVLCLQTVWVVSQPQQAAGEMPEELQVHWHRVSVCGVWGKGETHTHRKSHHHRWHWRWSFAYLLRCGRSGWMFTC